MHTYLQNKQLNLIKFTLHPWPRIMDSAGKRRQSQNVKWTGARAATAGPCCSCQRDSLAAGKLLALTDDPGAHGHERGASKMKQMNGANANLNGGKNVEGSGHGRQSGRQAKHSLLNRHCRQTQPADSPPGTGFKRTAHSWPVVQQKQHYSCR